ncbi:hypothetical protein JXA59_02385 [Patescibacteria group bacterium]|nr:hypothetical protein [Patescibacteria group bacterium]
MNDCVHSVITKGPTEDEILASVTRGDTIELTIGKLLSVEEPLRSIGENDELIKLTARVHSVVESMASWDLTLILAEVQGLPPPYDKPLSCRVLSYHPPDDNLWPGQYLGHFFIRHQ